MKLLKPEIDIIKHWKRDIFQPIVSISCITFNHEKYIRDALEGFIMQRTTFPFVIVILDDASTDGNPEIIREYEKKYPKLFRCFLLKENTWGKPNRREIIKPYLDAREEGKYTALCDGDDYWTDPYKLQKQVDFMEANEDFVMSFHSVDVENRIKKIDYKYPIPQKTVLRLQDIIFKHYIPTCSLLFKTDAMPKPFPEWFHKCPMGDIPLELMIAEKGLTKYFIKPMAVYRKHGDSITSNKYQIKNGRKGYLFIYQKLREYFGFRYWLIFTIMILKHRLGFVKDWVGLNPMLRSDN
jgi:glycosyltransferase involved in cell wall biosynthesis